MTVDISQLEVRTGMPIYQSSPLLDKHYPLMTFKSLHDNYFIGYLGTLSLDSSLPSLPLGKTDY